MQAIAATMPTLSVAMIYCIWFRAYLFTKQRSRKLRERVAYMLWVAATETP